MFLSILNGKTQHSWVHVVEMKTTTWAFELYFFFNCFDFYSKMLVSTMKTSLWRTCFPLNSFKKTNPLAFPHQVEWLWNCKLFLKHLQLESHYCIQSLACGANPQIHTGPFLDGHFPLSCLLYCSPPLTLFNPCTCSTLARQPLVSSSYAYWQRLYILHL